MWQTNAYKSLFQTSQKSWFAGGGGFADDSPNREKQRRLHRQMTLAIKNGINKYSTQQ
jgi:hypothetical protein